MQFLFDNLISTVVVLTLTLLLVTTMLRRTDETTGIANHQANAGRTASVASTLRRDVESLAAVDAIDDTSFAFSVALDPTVTPIPMGSVRYARRTRADGAHVVVRIDETAAERVVSPPLRGWDITLLDAADAPTAVLDDARQVHVRMVTAPAFGQPTDSLDVVWEHVFTPPLLGSPSF